MKTPLILSTWSFGQRANAAAWPKLSAGGSALDAVEAACRDAEEDLTNPYVGRGGYPDHTGRVSLDASIMLSPAKSGAVCCIRDHSCAISVARAVMERTIHKMLVGPDADAFADVVGLPRSELLTAEAKSAYDKWIAEGRPNFAMANIEQTGLSLAKPIGHDTIGSLALDASGTLAGGCTTSGVTFKIAGRVGDSPIIGHGLYVVPGIGAATCTGRGELSMGVCASFLAVESLRNGKSPQGAGRIVMQRIRDSFNVEADDQLGIIVLAADGRFSSAALQTGFEVAVRDATRDEVVAGEIVVS